MAGDEASRSEDKPWRLFVATDVPEDVRSRLAERLRPLRDEHPELRWSPQENWHVTLKFLGAVRPRVVDDARAGVAAAATKTDPFTSKLLGPDAFPNARRARVLWVGLADPDQRFGALAGALDVALAAIVKPDERRFTPHLTVARARQPVAIGDELASRAGLESESFPVDRVVLYRSHLRRPAPLYEAVETFPLG
ncbi:MAG: RNA 2',3'-cyclic phosphodiesterase [Actinomycetota bacterium]